MKISRLILAGFSALLFAVPAMASVNALTEIGTANYEVSEDYRSPSHAVFDLFLMKDVPTEKYYLSGDEFQVPNELEQDADEFKANPALKPLGLSHRKGRAVNVKAAPIVI